MLPALPPTYLYEKETAFFNFHPLALVDSVINLAHSTAHSALDSLQNFVDAHLGDSYECEVGMQRAATLLQDALDKNMDRWELYVLRNVFFVPPHVIPKKDAEDKGRSDRAMKRYKLMREIQQMKRLNARLKRDEKIAKSRLEMVQKAIEKTNSLQSLAKSKSATSFLRDQMDELKKLVEICSQYDAKVDALLAAKPIGTLPTAPKKPATNLLHSLHAKATPQQLDIVSNHFSVAQ